MSVDVRAYRRLLHAYPHRWRARRGEELLTVLVQDAEDRGRETPTFGDVLDLLTRGLEARIDAAFRGVPHELRSRAARLALVSASGLSVVLLLIAELPLPFSAGTVPPGFATLGPVMTVGVGVYAGWLVAGLALLAGRRGAARLTAAVTALLTVAVVPFAALTGTPRPPLYLLAVLVGFGVVASSSRLDGGRSTQALGFTAALLVAAALVRGRPANDLWDRRLGNYRWAADVYWVGYFAPWFTGAALAVALFLTIRGRPWLAATAVATLPWMYLSVFATMNRSHQEYLTGAALLTAAVLGVLAVWTIASRIGLRVISDRQPPPG
jgi:hypothetical protein